ncbi:MAG: hypothetical protein AAF196_16460 [Planctomycetota bacterium]
MAATLRTRLQAVIRAAENRAVTTELFTLGTTSVLGFLAGLLFESKAIVVTSMIVLGAALLRTVIHLERRSRFDAEEIDRRLKSGHRVRTWCEHEGLGSEFEVWLEEDLRERAAALAPQSVRSNIRERLDAWVGTGILLLLALLIAWLLGAFATIDGLLPFVGIPDSGTESTASGGFGLGSEGDSAGSGASGTAQGDGGESESDATEGDGQASEGQSSPEQEQKPEPRDDSAGAAEEVNDPEEEGTENPDEDPGSDPGSASLEDGEAPVADPERPDEDLFAEGPSVTEVAVPEFFGEGPSERTTSQVAGLDDTPRTDGSGPQPASGADDAAAPERPDSASEEPSEELDPRDFAPSEEWPLRARHVPENERDIVRRWFRRLAERSK